MLITQILHSESHPFYEMCLACVVKTMSGFPLKTQRREGGKEREKEARKEGKDRRKEGRKREKEGT